MNKKLRDQTFLSSWDLTDIALYSPHPCYMLMLNLVLQDIKTIVVEYLGNCFNTQTFGAKHRHCNQKINFLLNGKLTFQL